MATGMQTGMRTGSRMTAGRGAGAAPTQAGGLSKAKEIWNGLSKAMKFGIISLITLAIMGSGGFWLYSKQNKDVDLYTTKLSASDVKEVATQLTNLGIAHQVSVTGDGITIHPSLRGKALGQLAQMGLPKHQISTPATYQDSAVAGKTAKEMEQIRQRLLEGEITESLRTFDGIADCYVKIARPEQTFFKGDEKAVTATVALKLVPGTDLKEEQVRSIVHLVSFSVPELDKKNVKVIDGNMKDLTAMIDDSEGGAGSTAKQGAMENQKAMELTKKAQAQLDEVYGAGKTKVAVNCEMNFAKIETNRKTVGGAGSNGEVVVGKQSKIEKFDKGNGSSADPALQLDGEEATQTAGGSGDKKKSDYYNGTEVVKYDHDMTTTKEVRTTPVIQKITCSVAVNNLKEEQVANIAGLVSGAIGLDESRGDSIKVASVPFSQRTLDTITQEGIQEAFSKQNPTAAAAGGKTNGKEVAGQMGIFLSVASLGALGLIGIFLMKQHSSQVGRSQLLLDSNFSGGTSTDIADLRNDKSGKSTGSAATQVNASDALEKLAKEKPTDMAKMLKSTWLNG
jgi:flagellar M-ring protein FliF